MDTVRNIPKELQLPKGEDFSFLRTEGIRLIQEHCGISWTDHNLHDPGITVLEIFCYALTELSLKANIDIKDLLASSQANIHQALFLPEDILPAHPTTILDFRKILIDLDGVRNGWMIPLRLGEANNVNGLYDVLLELDDNLVLGDLNTSIIRRPFTIDFGAGDVRAYVMEVSFPFWDVQEVIDFREPVTINNIISPPGLGIVLAPTGPEDRSDYISELEVTYAGGINPNTTFSVTISISPNIGGDPIENLAVENEIQTALAETPGGGPADTSFLTTYSRKVRAASLIERNVFEELNGLRNLSEDFRQIKAIRIQEIALNARIDVLKPINLENYFANVLFELEQFLKPLINFSSFSERFEEDQSYEKLYDGPRLENGFITDELLRDLLRGSPDSRNSTVYVSDLLNILVKQAEENSANSTALSEDPVIAVSDLSISNFIRNVIVVDRARDCLILAKPELFKARFSSIKSNIEIYKDGVLVSLNMDLIENILVDLRAVELAQSFTSEAPILIQGAILPLEDFHSIQHDFPNIYGLGDNLLTNSYPIDRRAKVEQFRGFTAILDQLLGSYSKLLTRVNDLFSIDPLVENTYFKTPLYEIPSLERLLLSFLNGPLTWENFQADVDNDYQQILDPIYETLEVFLDRRNRFLDHLLARFAESVENYVFFRYDENSSAVSTSEELRLRQNEITHDIIRHKIRYLQLFPNHSKGRFKALNYVETSWDTTNCSGLSKRLITAIGLKNLNRRTLHNDVTNFIQINPAGLNFNFEILDSESISMLISVGVFATNTLARNAALELIQEAIHRDHFYLESQLNPLANHLIGFQTDATVLPAFLATATTPVLEDPFDARIEIRRIIDEIMEIGSGLYIVEHLLLRPDAEEVPPLLEIPMDQIPALTDPYSMRISIILPSGYERNFSAATDPVPGLPAQFRQESFRFFVEKQIKEETPPHIFPHIFWLDVNTVPDNPATPSINNFSFRWRAWLAAKANPATTIVTMQNRRVALITVLNSIFQL